jgi:hypothetical protein
MRKSSLHLFPIHFSVYEFILEYKTGHDGVSPSVLEIGNACKINSTSVVRHLLNTLHLFGMITCDYEKGKSRMISVPGARWVPPLNGNFSSPLKREDHVELVSGSSHKS